MTTPTVADLMSVPRSQHNKKWLMDSLQTAIEVEFATIPPYLCAWWSIQDNNHVVWKLLREVVMEEMAHLGMACNMLNSLGGSPDLKKAVLSYPDHLPGGVRPKLVVPLQGLTQPALKEVFMEIERPKHDVSGLDPDDNAPTIGEFYEDILDAFKALPDGTVSPTKQLSRSFHTVHNLKVQPIANAAGAAKAIAAIQEEGEGTSVSALDTTELDAGSPPNPADLAHYFRFAEIWKGQTLLLNGQGKWVYEGATISMPVCYPMAPVPKGGYKLNDPDPVVRVTQQVNAQLVEFDTQFTELVNAMQEAWENGNQTKLNAAVGMMYNLSTLGIALMTLPRDAGGGNYGPCFRLV
jgi:hypothetical protein